MTDRKLPPPWLDKPTLCEHISLSDRGVDAWVVDGILPPPRKRGAKLMWKWSEVDDWLTNGKPGASPDAQADAIRKNTQRAAAEARARH
jgi:predicted DNA-binding transcriptional regulator AlpA